MSQKTWSILKLVLCTILAAGAPEARAEDPFTLEWRELSRGVWAGVRPVSYASPPIGTVLIVIGEKGVFLFDPAATPLVADRVIAKVMELTPLPITHIAISHWHGDHSQGAYKIIEKHPKATIIAHEFTARAIASPLNAFTPPDDEANSATRTTIENALQSGKRSNGEQLSPEMRSYFENVLQHFDLVSGEAHRQKTVQPTKTFTDALSVDVGGRKIELRHMGPGNTNGDIIAYLPTEKILATGDIIVRPTPYGFYSHPRSWIAVLQQLKTLPAEFIVPGHGDIMTDTAYIDMLIDALIFVADGVDRLAADDMDLAEVRAALDWSAIENRFTNDDPLLALFFDSWFKAPIVEAQFKIAHGEDSERIDFAPAN